MFSGLVTVPVCEPGKGWRTVTDAVTVEALHSPHSVWRSCLRKGQRPLPDTLQPSWVTGSKRVLLLTTRRRCEPDTGHSHVSGTISSALYQDASSWDQCAHLIVKETGTEQEKRQSSCLRSCAKARNFLPSFLSLFCLFCFPSASCGSQGLTDAVDTFSH